MSGRLSVDQVPSREFDPSAVEDLISIVARAVTDLARIGSPADLAKILARQARDAKAAMPDDLKPVKPLLDDYRQALGLAFDIDDEKGARFFRSSLVQSIFYALFAAWILWDKEAGADIAFEVEDAHLSAGASSSIPMIEEDQELAVKIAAIKHRE